MVFTPYFDLLESRPNSRLTNDQNVSLISILNVYMCKRKERKMDNKMKSYKSKVLASDFRFYPRIMLKNLFNPIPCLQ